LGDDPVGEGVPEGGFAKGEADLLNENQECAGAERGAMNFTRGPVVVGDERKQKDVGEQGVDPNMSSAEGERPAGDGGDHQGGAGEIDIAFVGGGFAAVAESEKDERGEKEHVRQGNYVKGSGIAAEGVKMAGVAQEQISARKDAQNHHQATEEEAGDAETAVDVGASGSDEGGLRYEEKNPRGECGAVNVNDQAGQGRAKHTGEKITWRKADKNSEEHEQRHGGKEIVVVSAARRAGCGADRLVRLSGDCGQDASVRTWTGKGCAST